MDSAENADGKLAIVADDDEITRVLNTAILDSIGFGVITVEDGLELVKKYQERAKELAIILTDHNMPQLKGAEAVARIRQSNQTIPIIILSSESKQEEIDAINKSGANLFLSKPVDVSDLQNHVLSLTSAAGIEP